MNLLDFWLLFELLDEHVRFKFKMVDDVLSNKVKEGGILNDFT
jgi:hypothetical protein